jgi:hypothetical protein
MWATLELSPAPHNFDPYDDARPQGRARTCPGALGLGTQASRNGFGQSTDVTSVDRPLVLGVHDGASANVHDDASVSSSIDAALLLVREAEDLSARRPPGDRGTP